MESLWTAIAWTLTAAGVALFLYAAFWDRPARRGSPARRCRKCWYDLTANTAEPSREHPVVCPECGRKHATVRAMRRTRRPRRWMAAGLMLLVAAYGARAVPRVQQKGWGSAVPRVVLALSLPFLSEEQGTGLTGILPARSQNATGLDQFVLEEVPSGDAIYFAPASSIPRSEFGWLSRRIVFVLARF